MSVKLYVTRDGIAHRGVTKYKGDIIEESDSNHIGALQSVGCERYDELRHGKAKAAPKPEPVPEPEPEPIKEPEPAPAPPKKKTAGKPRKAKK